MLVGHFKNCSISLKGNNVFVSNLAIKFQFDSSPQRPKQYNSKHFEENRHLVQDDPKVLVMVETYPNLKEEIGDSISCCEISSSLDIKLFMWSSVSSALALSCRYFYLKL